MFKPIHMEINLAPSLTNTSPTTGVVSQLDAFAKNEPNYDGVTLENMRGNPLFSKFDDIDKVGIVQNRIIDNAKTIKSHSKQIRAFNDHAQKVRIPANNKK